MSTYSTGAKIEIGDWVLCTDPAVTREGWDYGRIEAIEHGTAQHGVPFARVRWASGSATDESISRIETWSAYERREWAAEALTEALAA